MEAHAHYPLELPLSSRLGTGQLQSCSSVFVRFFRISDIKTGKLTMLVALIVSFATLVYIHRQRRRFYYQEVREYYEEQMKWVPQHLVV